MVWSNSWLRKRSPYVVRLTDEERERLNGLISKGKHPARQLLKARILLKADASDAGEASSDSQIAAALETQRQHGRFGLGSGWWTRASTPS